MCIRRQLYAYAYIQFFLVNKESFITIKNIFQKAILLISFFIIPLILAPFWLYYSLWDLFLQRGFYGRFHTDSKVLYSDLLLSYYAFVLPIAMLVYCLVKRERYSYTVFFTITGLLLVYLLGYISGSFGYGRSISYMVIWIQMWVVSSLQKDAYQLYRKPLTALLFLSAIPFAFLSVKAVHNGAFTTHKDYINIKTGKDFIVTTSVPAITHRLFFIKDHIEEGSTVMTDLVTSRYVAAFGAKAIASPYSEYWVDDNERRMRDLNTFFSSNDSVILNKLLYKYKPKYLLLNPDAVYIKSMIASEMIKGEVVSKNGYILVPLLFEK